MEDLILDLALTIGGSVAGSFTGLLCYNEYRHRQQVDKIRCLVTMDVSSTFKIVTGIKNEALDEKEHEQTTEGFENFLKQNIIVINKITSGTATNLSRQYFNLPEEEMIKLELLYLDLNKFNKKMRSWGEELSKYEINKVAPVKNELCLELIKECAKLDELFSRITRLPWYKKWNKKLAQDSRFKDDV